MDVNRTIFVRIIFEQFVLNNYSNNSRIFEYSYYVQCEYIKLNILCGNPMYVCTVQYKKLWAHANKLRELAHVLFMLLFLF